MFNMAEWLVDGIVSGYSSGEFSFAKITELTAAYLAKGLITQSHVERIAELCPAPVMQEEGEEINGEYV